MACVCQQAGGVRDHGVNRFENGKAKISADGNNEAHADVPEFVGMAVTVIVTMSVAVHETHHIPG